MSPICHKLVTSCHRSVTDLSPHCHKYVTRCHRDVTSCHSLVSCTGAQRTHAQQTKNCFLTCVCRTRRVPQRRNGFWNFTSLSRVSPGCHMCHKIVTEMSQDCPAASRDVADVSPDVTEMSRASHIFVTRCHKLSQQLSHQSRRVTECQYICRHVNKPGGNSWAKSLTHVVCPNFSKALRARRYAPGATRQVRAAFCCDVAASCCDVAARFAATCRFLHSGATRQALRARLRHEPST